MAFDRNAFLAGEDEPTFDRDAFLASGETAAPQPQPFDRNAFLSAGQPAPLSIDTAPPPTVAAPQRRPAQAPPPAALKPGQMQAPGAQLSNLPRPGANDIAVQPFDPMAAPQLPPPTIAPNFAVPSDMGASFYEKPTTTAEMAGTVAHTAAKAPRGFIADANSRLAGLAKAEAAKADMLGWGGWRDSLLKAAHYFEDSASIHNVGTETERNDIAGRVGESIGMGLSIAAQAMLLSRAGARAATPALLFGLPSFGETYFQAKKGEHGKAYAATIGAAIGAFNTFAGKIVNKLAKIVPPLGKWLEAEGKQGLELAIQSYAHTASTLELMQFGNALVQATAEKGGFTIERASELVSDWWNNDAAMTLIEAIPFAAQGMIGKRPSLPRRPDPATSPEAEAMRASGVPEDVIQRTMTEQPPAPPAEAPLRPAEQPPAAPMAVPESPRPQEPIPAATTRHVNQDAADALSKEIERDYGIATPLRAVDRPAGERAAEADAAERMAAVLGKNVVWVEPGEKGVRFGGTVDESTVYVNAKSENAYHGIVTHEVIDRLEREAPDLHAKLIEAARDIPGIQRVFDEISGHYKAQGIEPPKGDAMWREAVSDAMQKEGTKPEFWRKVYEKAPDVVRKIVETLQQIIEKIRNVTVPRDVEAIVGDIQKFHDVAAGVMAEFIGRKTAQSETDPAYWRERLAATGNKKAVESFDEFLSKPDADPTKAIEWARGHFAKQDELAGTEDTFNLTGEKIEPAVPKQKTEAELAAERAAKTGDLFAQPAKPLTKQEQFLADKGITREQFDALPKEQQAALNTEFLGREPTAPKAGSKFDPNAKRMKRGASRKSDAVNEPLARWREMVSGSGIGTSMSAEDMGIGDRPGIRREGGMEWDEALTRAHELGLITEDQLTEPSVIGDLLRGANLSPQELQRRQNRHYEQQAAKEVLQRAQQGYEVTKADVKGLGDSMKPLVGIGRSARNPIKGDDGVHVYRNSDMEWRVRDGDKGKWRTLNEADNAEQLAELREKYPGLSEMDMASDAIEPSGGGAMPSGEGLPFSIERPQPTPPDKQPEPERTREHKLLRFIYDAPETSERIKAAIAPRIEYPNKAWEQSDAEARAYIEQVGMYDAVQALKARNTGLSGDANVALFQFAANHLEQTARDPSLSRSDRDLVASHMMDLIDSVGDRLATDAGRTVSRFREVHNQLFKSFENVSAQIAYFRSMADQLAPNTREELRNERDAITEAKRAVQQEAEAEFRRVVDENDGLKRQLETAQNIIDATKRVEDATLNSIIAKLKKNPTDRDARVNLFEQDGAEIDSLIRSLVPKEDAPLSIEKPEEGSRPREQPLRALPTDAIERIIKRSAAWIMKQDAAPSSGQWMKWLEGEYGKRITEFDGMVDIWKSARKAVETLDVEISKREPQPRQRGQAQGEQQPAAPKPQKSNDTLRGLFQWARRTGNAGGEMSRPSEVFPENIGGTLGKWAAENGMTGEQLNDAFASLRTLARQKEAEGKLLEWAKSRGIPDAEAAKMAEEFAALRNVKDLGELGKWAAENGMTGEQLNDALASLRTLARQKEAQGKLLEWAKARGIPDAEAAKMAEEFAALRNVKDLGELGKWFDENRDKPAGQSAADFVPEFLSPRASAEAARINPAEIIRQIRASGRTVKQAILDYYAGKGDPAETLYDRIRAMGLPEADTAKLIAKTAEVWRKMMDSEVGKILQKKYGDKIAGQKRSNPSVFESLMNDIRMGALSDATIRKRLAEKYGLPELTPADIEQMQRNAQELLDARARSSDPDTDPRVIDASERARKFIYGKIGTGWGKIGSSYMYWSLLSGPATWGWNLSSTALLGAKETAISAAMPVRKALTAAATGNFRRAYNQLLRVPLVLSSTVGGIPLGIIEAAYVMKTGNDPFHQRGEGESKWGSYSVFEIPTEYIRDPAQRRALTVAKYLGFRYARRILIATDALFRLPLREQRAALLEANIAEEMGLSGRELLMETYRRLGYTENAKAFWQEAGDQGLRGVQRAISASAMMEKLRDPSAIMESNLYAAENTYNTRNPYGTAGAMARALNDIASHNPALRPVALFTRIAANVMNKRMEYFPPTGYYRAFRGERTLRKFGEKPNVEKLTPDEREATAMRATMGLAIAATVLVKALQAYNDWKKKPEEERANTSPEFEITAMGPRNANVAKAQRSIGAKRYAMRINGKDVPMSDSSAYLALAFVGSWMDQERYGDEETKKDTMLRTATAMSAVLAAGAEDSFLTGAMRMMDLATGKGHDSDPMESFGKFAASQSRILMPAGLKQIGEFFDPMKYKADDLHDYFLQTMPVVRGVAMNPDVNIMGDDITNEPLGRFGTKYKKDPEIQWLINLGYVPNMPPRGKGFAMSYSDNSNPAEWHQATELEYYKLTKEAGQEFRALLRQTIPQMAGLSAEDKKSMVSSLRQIAVRKAEMNLIERRHEEWTSKQSR